MKRNAMLVVGLAGAFVLAAPVAYAQTSQPGAAGSQPQAQPGTAPSRPGMAQNQKMNKADERFLTEAMQGDLAEVQMGELAQQKGQSDRVKEFGQTLVKDHGDHSKKLQQLGQQMGATLPTEPSAKQRAEHEKLGKLMGTQFDRTFARQMVEDHRRDIAKYQAAAKKPGPIGDLAKETVPTLQQHLKMAEDLSRPAPTTGAGGAGGSGGGAGGNSGGTMGGTRGMQR
jgi:putative membrane protein